ncbi:hypothetical protein SDC9_171069 [bioreactor metagenome]|uniref:Uncharacterized protein n=1 Tax=bioreactor metagenome TaxID=1076179 RepID=A0A645GC27_9ZZZZ
MNEKIIGATKATERLLIRLYAVRLATLPFSIPVMTGAAVAVGASIQIITP